MRTYRFRQLILRLFCHLKKPSFCLAFSYLLDTDRYRLPRNRIFYDHCSSFFCCKHPLIRERHLFYGSGYDLSFFHLSSCLFLIFHSSYYYTEILSVCKVLKCNYRGEIRYAYSALISSRQMNAHASMAFIFLVARTKRAGTQNSRIFFDSFCDQLFFINWKTAPETVWFVLPSGARSLPSDRPPR